MSGAQILITRL